MLLSCFNLLMVARSIPDIQNPISLKINKILMNRKMYVYARMKIFKYTNAYSCVAVGKGARHLLQQYNTLLEW